MISSAQLLSAGQQKTASLPALRSASSLWIVRTPFADVLGTPHLVYSFFVLNPRRGMGPNFCQGLKPEMTVRWPWFFDIQKPDFGGWMGFITYRLEGGGVATSLDYWPRIGFVYSPSAAPIHFRFPPAFYSNQNSDINIRCPGYYPEFFTTSLLQTKENISFIATTSEPSWNRVRQLQRVWLPIGEPVPIADWQDGMREGVRLTVEFALNGFVSEKAGAHFLQPALIHGLVGF